MAHRHRRTSTGGDRLLGPTAATFAANALIILGNALAGIISARALGPTGRGQLTAVVLWSAVIHTVGSLGIPASLSYHLASWPHRRGAVVTWLRRVAAYQVTVMTAVSALVMWLLHRQLDLSPVLAAQYATWAAGGTISLYGAACAQGCRDFTVFNVIRLVVGAGPAVAMAFAAAAVRLTPATAGAAYLAPTWCGAALAVMLLRRAASSATDPPLSRCERRSLWSYGGRNLASLSGLALNRSSDQLALGILVQARSLGVYSVAAAASGMVPSVIASFGMVGLPRVASLTEHPKAAATWQVMRRASVVVVVTTPVVAVALPWAVPLVYGARYATAVAPAEILLAGSAFAALTTVTDDLLRAHGSPGFVSIAQGAGGLVTAVGSLLLDGRPLVAVSAVSAVGFAVSYLLALVRLRKMTRTRHGRRRGPARPAAAVRRDELHEPDV